MPRQDNNQLLLGLMAVLLMEGTALAQDGVCSIQSMFSGLSAIKQDPDCRQGCDHNSGDCSQDWTPGSADECSAACGRVFEPFWVCLILCTEETDNVF